jgi:hypothetical protein
MNQLVRFENNRPLFKDGTTRDEIFSSVPKAEPKQILQQLGLMFATLASREDMPDEDKIIRNQIYAQKLQDYPQYAIEAAVTKFIDEEIFVPAVSELVKEVRDQVFKKIVWTDVPKKQDPFEVSDAVKQERAKRAEFVKDTIKKSYGNQEGAPTGSIKAKSIDQRQSGEERRAAMERLKARAADLDDDKQEAGMKFLGFAAEKREAS